MTTIAQTGPAAALPAVVAAQHRRVAGLQAENAAPRGS
jgi:hypothetical protein